MATYPQSLPIAKGATYTVETDRKIERATNGTARVRVFYTTAKRKFSIEHPALKAAEVATFDAFYSANKAATFDFIWPVDGVTYSCIFCKEPSYKPQGGFLTNISLELDEV